MKNARFRLYYGLSVLGVLAASAYPLYMGIRVLVDLIRFGAVEGANYPKYLIPYTPVSVAVILGVLLMPLVLDRLKRWAIPAVSAFSVAIFLMVELLLEKAVIVTTDSLTTLGSWQMFMCYTPRYYTPEQILFGDYHPGFKLHFYVIAILLVLTFLNCFYGFGQMILTGNKKRLTALTLQSVSSVIFLGLCILACFTAFFRTGTIEQGTVPAVLMILFFVVFGVTAGIYAGSFTRGRCRWLSVWLPVAVAMAVATLMYIGEMILLSGKLYRFGSGFFFDGLGALVLAPVDIAVILAAGFVTAAIFLPLSRWEERVARVAAE